MGAGARVKMANDNEQLLCLKDVAQMLGVSEQLVMRLVHRNEIVYVRVGVKLLRFHRDDVQDYIRRQRVATSRTPSSPKPKGKEV